MPMRNGIARALALAAAIGCGGPSAPLDLGPPPTATTPETSSPETSSLPASSPAAITPGAASPDAAFPGAASPDAAFPGAASPDAVSAAATPPVVGPSAPVATASNDEGSPAKTDRLAILPTGGPVLCDLELWMDGARVELDSDVRSRRTRSGDARANSRVWEALDGDGSGWLSADEVQSSSGRLVAYDTDDDWTLAPDEFASLRERLEADGGVLSTPQEKGVQAAILLDTPSEATRWDYLLTDLYAPLQTLNRNSFPDVQDLFERLDADADDALSTTELAALAQAEAHGKAVVRFAGPSSADATRPAPSAQLEWIGRASHKVQRQSGERSPAATVVEAGRTRILWIAHQYPAAPSESSSATPSPTRLPTPLPSQSAQPVAPQLQAPTVRATVHDQCDALFMELDVNGDGQLGEREIAESSRHLASVDQNEDGRVDATEVPYWLVATLVVGAPKDGPMFSLPPRNANRSQGSVGKDRPSDWFSGADMNGDGDVSQREFLGPREKFAQLDANSDGFIAPEERP